MKTPALKPENFDRPYGVDSLSEFWRRWHMSLSCWIRDYIYIPLGGNRAQQSVNLLVAMALCGLWHGARWNFAVWGIYHGTDLVIEAGVQRVWPQGFSDRTPLGSFAGRSATSSCCTDGCSASIRSTSSGS